MTGQEPIQEAWSPTILDPTSENDRLKIDALRSDPSSQLFDHRNAQLEELRRLRPPVARDILDDPGRWVYYPWRRALVTLVGPRAFSRLRLDRNRNKITAPEQEVLASQRIGVIGLSVGHVIAHTLALEGLCGVLRLADFDCVEVSNLNRIPATLFDLGVNKAVVTARRIAELDPYLKIEVVSDGVTEESVDTFVEGLDIVIEECDSLDVKLVVRESARRHQVPVIMETSDRGLLDVERFDLEPKRPAFHGLLGELQASDLAALSTHAKVPHVLRILEPERLSARMAASMAEIDYTLTTWPQLGGDVTLGGASVAAAVRRLGCGLELSSGRVRIDVESALSTISAPSPPLWPMPSARPAATAEAKRINGRRRHPQVEPELDETMRAVLGAATLAPSGGNTQPWIFTPGERCWSIDVDPSRSSTMDVRLRASFVAAGAALFNARVAAARHGVLGSFELFPDSRNGLRVASVRFGEDRDRELASHFEPMLRRCTNRQPGSFRPIGGAMIAALEEAARSEGASVRLYCSRDTVTEMGRLLGESDRLRYLSPALHVEMMSELRWPGHDPLEVGLDVRTLELDGSDLAKLNVARRSDVMECLAAWGGGAALGEVTRDRVGSSSAIAVVTVPDADPLSYVHGGSAIQRLWITAEMHGLSVQPVSPVFLFALDEEDRRSLVPSSFTAELEGLNAAFRQLTGLPDDERPALLLRLSHASLPTARSRRLPLSAVLRSTGR